jgi:hypothetical protein
VPHLGSVRPLQPPVGIGDLDAVQQLADIVHTGTDRLSGFLGRAADANYFPPPGSSSQLR